MVKQSTRDIACAVTFVMATAYYAHTLSDYFADLQNPWLLKTAFFGSLILSLYREFQHGFSRPAFARAAATVLSFALSVLIAQGLRAFYLASTGEMKGDPEVEKFLGSDLYSALMNRTLGYGSSFALGLLMVRVTVHKPLEKLLVNGFVLPQNIPRICEHCQQPIPDHL